VFDIFNCPHITLRNSNFTNNRGTGISRVPYRANTGAVSVGYNNMETDTLQPVIVVSGCHFVNNQATARSAFRTTSNAFFNRVFTGRGGGLGIFINDSSHNITGMISDNSFVGNYARSFGGGFYIVVFGDVTQNTLLIESNVFENNLADLGGGGLSLTFFSSGLKLAPHSSNLTDCLFKGNAGQSGGAISIFHSYQSKLAAHLYIQD